MWNIFGNKNKDESKAEFSHSSSDLVSAMKVDKKRGEFLQDAIGSLMAAYLGRGEEANKYPNFVKKTHYIEHAINLCENSQERMYVSFAMGLAFARIDAEADNMQQSMIHAIGLLSGLRQMQNASKQVVKLGEFYLDIDMDNVELSMRLKSMMKNEEEEEGEGDNLGSDD